MSLTRVPPACGLNPTTTNTGMRTRRCLTCWACGLGLHSSTTPAATTAAGTLQRRTRQQRRRHRQQDRPQQHQNQLQAAAAAVAAAAASSSRRLRDGRVCGPLLNWTVQWDHGLGVICVHCFVRTPGCSSFEHSENRAQHASLSMSHALVLPTPTVPSAAAASPDAATHTCKRS